MSDHDFKKRLEHVFTTYVSRNRKSPDESSTSDDKLWIHDKLLWFVPMATDVGVDEFMSASRLRLPTTYQRHITDDDALVGVYELTHCASTCGDATNRRGAAGSYASYNLNKNAFGRPANTEIIVYRDKTYGRLSKRELGLPPSGSGLSYQRDGKLIYLVKELSMAVMHALEAEAEMHAARRQQYRQFGASATNLAKSQNWQSRAIYQVRGSTSDTTAPRHTESRMSPFTTTRMHGDSVVLHVNQDAIDFDHDELIDSVVGMINERWPGTIIVDDGTLGQIGKIGDQLPTDLPDDALAITLACDDLAERGYLQRLRPGYPVPISLRVDAARYINWSGTSPMVDVEMAVDDGIDADEAKDMYDYVRSMVLSADRCRPAAPIEYAILWR